MDRIRFNITAAITRWRARRHVNLQRFRMMELRSLDDLPLGPGWFDSSWDLGQGLQVEVALPGDPTFQAWIEAQARSLLAAAQAPRPAAVEGALEYEPVEWTNWERPDDAAQSLSDAVVADLPADLEVAGLKFEIESPQPELSLVPI